MDFKKISYGLLILYFLIGLVYVFRSSTVQVSDGRTYMGKLDKMYREDVPYPSENDRYDNYINNPGALNLYGWVWKLSGRPTVRILYFLNLCMLTGALFLLQQIILHYRYDNRALALTSLFWIFYLPNLGLIATITSDVAACFFLTLYVFLRVKFVQGKQVSYVMYAGMGLFIAVIEYIRPVGVILLAAEVLWLLSAQWTRRSDSKLKLSFTLTGARTAAGAGFLMVVAFLAAQRGIGYWNVHKGGVYNYKSVSMGYNFLMGTYPHSDGTWTGGVFNPGGAGYFDEIGRWTTEAKNSRWTAQSIGYILEDPLRAIGLGFRKLMATYTYDVLALNKVIFEDKYVYNFNAVVTEARKLPGNIFEPRVLAFIWNNLVYLSLAFSYIFLWGKLIFRFASGGEQEKLLVNNLYGLVFIILYSGVIFIVVGGSRYHFAVMPFVFLGFGSLMQLYLGL
ncbi:MAG: hypothetical protein ACOYOO_14765, partial [Saprospiraceae bacterium]